MRLTNLTLTVVLATAALALPLDAQRNQLPRFAPDDLVLTAFTPSDPALAHSIYESVHALFGRPIEVLGAEGVAPRVVNNMSLLHSSTLVVYDEQANADRMLDAARKFEAVLVAQSVDADPAPDLRASSLVAKEIRPRYASLDAVWNGLGSYRRQLQITDEHGGGYAKDNLTILRDRGTLVVRETPQLLAEIEKLLAAIDRPAPEVMLVAQLVRASDEPVVDSTLPDELVSNLGALVGRDHFALESTATVRMSARTGAGVELLLDHADGAYSLRLRAGAYDAETQTLTLDACEVGFTPRAGDGPVQSGPRTVISTSCSLTEDEYSVIGSTGRRPLFLVLRSIPVARQAGQPRGSR